jgi:predicted DNA-binding antitoxin AbrB/MazE fold protein
MTLHGHIENGVIVLNQQVSLPEGATVQVQIIVPPAKTTDGRELPTLAETLKDFIGVLEDLPEDAATNHDHYLYNTPKKS